MRRTAWGIVIAAIPPACLTNHAGAVPDFAQQTGQACSTCHIGSFGPQLTPFGREFKLGAIRRPVEKVRSPEFPCQ